MEWRVSGRGGRREETYVVGVESGSGEHVGSEGVRVVYASYLSSAGSHSARSVAGKGSGITV